jgi:hypothetical protein
MDRDEFLNKRIARLARERGCTVDEANAELDALARELDDELFLQRMLATELRRLDELEDAFHSKAIAEKDAEAGELLVKIHELRVTLLTQTAAWPSSPVRPASRRAISG